jgi:hypothetical protein
VATTAAPASRASDGSTSGSRLARIDRDLAAKLLVQAQGGALDSGVRQQPLDVLRCGRHWDVQCS